MEPEDVSVREALHKAGFGALPANTRGDLHWTLTKLMQSDPEGNGELVDRLREILGTAEARDNRIAFEQLRTLHKTIKGCPDCGSRPDFLEGLLPGRGEAQVVCLHETDATIRPGLTLADAIESWNNDDWTAGAVRAVYDISDRRRRP
ncbi:hypothetical protein [Pseudomonas reactans]|uniref:hypothetical protein n=1 Tax=Pseudomonas reactans TaxID=117680 RepID=UPI00159F899D|nr:hypothetical protein [Pseudomonas reactans]NWC89999.1 hypothetical protein [Pseudomonas reactans]